MRKFIVMFLVLAFLASISFVAFAGEGTLLSPNITATVVGPRQVDVSWEPAPGENVGYGVIRSKTDNPNLFTALGTVSASVYSYTDTSVNPNTSYYYAVTPIYLQSQSTRIEYRTALVTTIADTSQSGSTSTSSSSFTSTNSESTEVPESEPIQTTGEQPETEPENTVKVTTLKIGNQQMNVHGKSVSLDVAPKIENGRTLVPLRAISEALGAEVIWDEKTQTITVISKQGH